MQLSDKLSKSSIKELLEFLFIPTICLENSFLIIIFISNNSLDNNKLSLFNLNKSIIDRFFCSAILSIVIC